MKDIFDATPLAFHRYAGAVALQPIRLGGGCELATLIGIYDRGAPNRWMASFDASTQKSASRVLDMHQARTLCVNQAMMSTR